MLLLVERRRTRTELNVEPHEPYREPPFECQAPDLAGPDAAGSLVVSDVVGELTNPPRELHPRVESLMQRGERVIVFNLARVTGWDRTGLGEPISCYVTVVRSGRRCELINAPRRFRDWVAAMRAL